MATLEVRGGYDNRVQRALRIGLPRLRAALDASDRHLPGFVWSELERTAGCGDPHHGFAWLYCERCEHHRLLPFTCKARGFCPTCIGRRMAERARGWCEDLLPFEVPHRQWVLTVPWRRRPLLAYRPEVARGVLDLALRLIFGWLAHRAEVRLGVAGGRAAAVTVEQRCGSSLALNLHFHCILPDGVVAPDADGALRFHRVVPDRAAIDQLVTDIATAAEAWLAEQGVDEDHEPDPDDARAVLAAASTQGRVASGPRAGRPVRRLGASRGDEDHDHSLGAGSEADGYGLHAGTWVPAQDRKGLEQLCRYLLRPPLPNDRLTERPDGSWFLALRKPWRDGTAGFLFSALELTEKLAALVVRPRVHTTHFHGLFAGNATGRDRVVPTDAQRDAHADATEANQDAKRRRRRLRRVSRSRWSPWCPWVELLEYVFAVDGHACPDCGGPLHLRAVVHRHATARKILADLRRSARPPPPTVVPACP